MKTVINTIRAQRQAAVLKTWMDWGHPEGMLRNLAKLATRPVEPEPEKTVQPKKPTRKKK